MSAGDITPWLALAAVPVGLWALRQNLTTLIEAVTNRYDTEEEFWRSLLTGVKPGVPMYRMRSFFSLLRSGTRCKVCHIPFEGPGAVVFGILWSGRSHLTPHFCRKCEDFARRHVGGAEVEMTMLFVDIRGSTALAETMSASAYRALVCRFYDVASRTLTDEGAWIDKFVGDEAIGLFIPGFAGEEHAYLAVKSARALLLATGHGSPEGPWVPLGIGINTGTVFMGTVGGGSRADITALGDEMNVAARVASVARAGELAFSERTRAAIGPGRADFLATLGAEERDVELKGKSAPVKLHVWTAAA